MSKVEPSYKKMNIQGKEIEVYQDHPVRVCCLEHLERELDDYVDQYEIAPDMYRREEVEESDVSSTCMVCGAEGSIVLLHVKGM